MFLFVSKDQFIPYELIRNSPEGQGYKEQIDLVDAFRSAPKDKGTVFNTTIFLPQPQPRGGHGHSPYNISQTSNNTICINPGESIMKEQLSCNFQ